MARIDELPVPDWGLKCPHCGHAIAGLPEHRCGACGEPFNIFQVVARHRPIPDIGLSCPNCEHSLTGLIGSRCPECGEEFSVRDLIEDQSETGVVDEADPADFPAPHIKRREPVFTGQERPMPDFGLSCAKCEEPLTGATDNHCPHCGQQFDLAEFAEGDEWVSIQTFAPPELLASIGRTLYGAEIPYLRDQSRTITAYTGEAPVVLPGILVPREFFFDALYAMQEAARPVAECARQPWTCPGCEEDVPAGFEICWNCGRSHPQAGGDE